MGFAAARFLALMCLVLFVVWTLAPIVLMVHTSLAYSGVASGQEGLRLSLANYRDVLLDGENVFLKALLTSLALSTVVAAATVMLAFPAAYALALFRENWVQATGSWILSTRFLPPIVAAVPLFVLLRFVRIGTGLFTLVVVDLLVGLGLAVWVLRSYIADLPANLHALAEADGLSRHATMVRVLVPSLKAPLMLTFALVWLLVWSEYLLGLLFAGSSTPLPVVIASWNTYQGIQWGQACAAGVLSALPPVVVAAAFSARQVLRTISLGWRSRFT